MTIAATPAFTRDSVDVPVTIGRYPRIDPRVIRWYITHAEEGFCTYCYGDAEHHDHLIPRSLGGTDDPSNLVPACKRCNMCKTNRAPESWLSTMWRKVRGGTAPHWQYEVVWRLLCPMSVALHIYRFVIEDDVVGVV